MANPPLITPGTAKEQQGFERCQMVSVARMVACRFKTVVTDHDLLSGGGIWALEAFALSGILILRLVMKVPVTLQC